MCIRDRPLLHFAANTRPGFLEGRPPLDWWSTTIQTALVLRQFAYGFVREGVKINYVLSAGRDAEQDQIDALDQLLNKKRNADGRNVLILPGEVSVQGLSMKLIDAQFMELSADVNKQIVRAYGVPSHLVATDFAQSRSYSNLSQDIRFFVENTLARWLTLLETTFMAWLPDGIEIRFDTDGLTMPNKSERAQIYGTMIDKGIITPQEARDYEGIAGVAPGVVSGGGVEEEAEDDDDEEE